MCDTPINHMEKEINEILEKYYDYASVPATEKLVALITRVTDELLGEKEVPEVRVISMPNGETVGVDVNPVNKRLNWQRIKRDELLSK